jgi:hypothetical protein
LRTVAAAPQAQERVTSEDKSREATLWMRMLISRSGRASNATVFHYRRSKSHLIT